MYDIQRAVTNENNVYWILTKVGDFYTNPIVLKDVDISNLVGQITGIDPNIMMKTAGKNILWYFVHPYSAKTREEEIVNFDLCNRRASTLMDNGYHLISPISHSHNIHQVKARDHAFWMKIDEMLMSRCNGAIFAPRWEESEGCRIEHRWFTSNKKPILYYAELCKKFAK